MKQQKLSLTFTAKVYLAARKSGLGGRAEWSMILRKTTMRPNFGTTAPRNNIQIQKTKTLNWGLVERSDILACYASYKQT